LRTLLDRRGAHPVLVFGRTKHGVKKLAQRLETLGYPAAALQGNLSQNARERVMAGFRSGAVPILLATNVAARGLDVPGVSQVINYELPESAEWFTHRVGRTGRMGNSGQAITLLTPEDSTKWRQIEKALGRRLERRRWTHTESTPSTASPESHTRSLPQRPQGTVRTQGGDPQVGRSLEAPASQGSTAAQGQGSERTLRPQRADGASATRRTFWRAGVRRRRPVSLRDR
jgi:superfamily II DNA/RNA helicase